MQAGGLKDTSFPTAKANGARSLQEMYLSSLSRAMGIQEQYSVYRF